MVASVSLGPYVHRLLDRIGHVMVSLTFLGSVFLHLQLVQDFQALTKFGCGFCICSHQLVGEDSPMMIILGFIQQVEQNIMTDHFIDISPHSHVDVMVLKVGL